MPKNSTDKIGRRLLEIGARGGAAGALADLCGGATQGPVGGWLK
jgi:hypothetical protein